MVAAERALSEPQVVVNGRVAEDVHLVDAQFACEAASDAELSAGALLAAASPRWIDERRGEHAPSTRTKLSQRLPADHLLFEVPAGEDGLLRPRVYDPRTGDPLHVRERRGARLSLAGAAQRSVIAPWPRAHDRALDLFVDRLARTLAAGAPYDTLSETSEGHAAIESAAELYAQALARFAPKELRVEHVGSEQGRAEVTLTLSKGSSAAAQSARVSFTFELAVKQGQHIVQALRDPALVRRAIACSDDHGALELRALRARTEARSATRERTEEPPQEALCNALGTLLPAPCERDPRLLADALSVATRCGDHRALGLTLRGHAAPPADFAVSLRRGRALTSLEPTPRYTLAIERSGRVTFDSAEAAGPTREGRTSTALVAALHDQVARLRYFARPGRHDGQLCKADDERGDTLVIRAGGRERGVRQRDGCRGPFTASELDVLLRAVEQVAALKGFATPSSQLDTRDPDVWIVAAE
jgi:hypothetical protein